MNHKTLSIAVRKGLGTPSESQLSVINSMTLREMKAEDLYVRTFLLAHNGIDRDGEVFDEALLDDFARTLKGKGLFVKHPNSPDGDSGPGEGVIFDAYVETVSFEEARTRLGTQNLRFPPDRTSAKLLYASAYLAATADNASLRTKIDAGIAGYASIGFEANASKQTVNDANGKPIAKRWLPPGEGNEMSLVWLGAQQGARAVKNANREDSSAMDPNQDLETARKSARESGEKLAAAEPKAKAFDAIKSALGTADAALADNPAQLVKLAQAGKAYRKNLVDGIITAERHLKITADTPEAETKARAQYEELSTESLEGFAKRYEAQLPKGGKVGASDPNAGNGGDKAVKPAPGGFFDSPLITANA